MQVSDSNVAGRLRGMPAWFNTPLSGLIDASGDLEGQGYLSFSPLKLRGSLSADTGAGSGMWSTDFCEGTFELVRAG